VAALQARGACVGLLSSARLYATGNGQPPPHYTYPHTVGEGISRPMGGHEWRHLKRALLSHGHSWLHHQIGFLVLFTSLHTQRAKHLCCVVLRVTENAQLCHSSHPSSYFEYFTPHPPPQKRMMMVHNPRVGCSKPASLPLSPSLYVVCPERKGRYK
jgi:hypothetical protein